MRRSSAIVAAVASMIVAACGGSSTTSNTSSTSNTSGTSTSTVAPTVTTTTAPPTTAQTTTTSAETTTTTTTSATTTTTSATTTTTTTTVPEPDCDRGVAAGILDDAIALARLAADGEWTDQTAGIAFDGRTNSAEEFGTRLAYGCSLRLAQRTEAGAERLALVAWNDRRHAAVVQATDEPATPYREDARFQLFIEQPWGEFLVDQFVWAATMEGGESIVISTDDYSIGITAKSWQSAVPPFDDIPVTLEAEHFAIDALRAVGARNVSVAEPASVGHPIGTVQFNTPHALNAFAVIGPVDAFDPMVPIVADGDTEFHEIDGVEVRLTAGLELDMFDLFETGWRCGSYSWRIYAGLGSPAEVLEFTRLLVPSLTC